MNIKLEIDGYRSLLKPRVEYDSIRIGSGDIHFFKGDKHVASMDKKVYVSLGDTLNISGLRGYLDVDLK